MPADKPSGRLYILNSDEIAALYERPKFDDEERIQFFALSAEAQLALAHWHTFSSRITFILQLGYFKAVQQFFTFELADVAEDVAWIQQTYFPSRPPLTKLVSKGTRLSHQAQILRLHNYRHCSVADNEQLEQRAHQAVRISSKPRFVLRELQHFLSDHALSQVILAWITDLLQPAFGT